MRPFAHFVGTIVKDIKKKILLVCEPNTENEAVTRCTRVGFDNVLGYLEGGMEAWIKAGHEYDTVDLLSPENFAKGFGKTHAVDVRPDGLYNSSHLKDVEHFNLEKRGVFNFYEKDKKEAYYTVCETGYLSMI